MSTILNLIPQTGSVVCPTEPHPCAFRKESNPPPYGISHRSESKPLKIYLDRNGTYLVTSVVIPSHHPCRSALSRHCHKVFSATLLESALTNRDACNSFRIRSCENSQVASSLALSLTSHETLSRDQRLCKSFFFNALQTLQSLKSCKSFACHSYENCRVYTKDSHSGTHSSTFVSLPHSCSRIVRAPIGLSVGGPGTTASRRNS
jgi:hypothetical protein